MKLLISLFPIIIMTPLNSFYCFSPLHENANANGTFTTSPTSRPPPERQLANTMTSSSSLPPNVSGISKELAELRHLVQFPEEIACILTEQEQQLYQQVGTLVKKKSPQIQVCHHNRSDWPRVLHRQTLYSTETNGQTTKPQHVAILLMQ